MTRSDDRGADDTTGCDDLLRRMTLRDDGRADDRGADDTTRCDDLLRRMTAERMTLRDDGDGFGLLLGYD